MGSDLLQAPSHSLQANRCRAADGYKGYAKLYQPEPDGARRLRQAACRAHLRRDFHDFRTSTKSDIACQALDRTGKLYAIKRTLNGQPAEARPCGASKAEPTRGRGLLCLARASTSAHSGQE